MRSKRLMILLIALAGTFITSSLFLYPEESFNAALSGMRIFFDVVFPSLLPFFILSEILLGLGVVHGLSILLEPLMRPLFNVPGAGAFALSMGLAAGYPMDAIITAKFRKQELCTRVEGERLLAFSNTADPLFMFGAVAVGLFGMPKLGAILAIAHYLGAFAVGLVYRFYGRSEDRHEARSRGSGNIFKRAIDAIVDARIKDARPFGKLFSDAVYESVLTLLKICGYIMFFSVVIEVLEAIGIINMLAIPLQSLFIALGWDSNLVLPMLSGIVEIDIGVARIAVASAPLLQKVVMASAIIAWSGFSVLGQVSSVLAESDISLKPYIFARVLHAAFAAVFTLILLSFMPLQQAIEAIPTFFSFTPLPDPGQPWSLLGRTWLSQLYLAGSNLGIMLCLSLSAWGLSKLQLIGFKR